MEDKQLNFNQPLLSVRRHSSTAVSGKEDKRSSRSVRRSIPRPPPYKSELTSGPAKNAGTVPFVWEQSPGRPKDESRRQTNYVERPSTAPKLHPGRIPKADCQESDNVVACSTSERIQSANVNNFYANPVIDKNSKGGLRYAEDPKEEDENSDSSNEEVYVDALDTLSRTESFFLNCSMSGVSGFEDAKLPGTFPTDPQAKDFMIGRFLPAAKAMVSESPLLAPPKKQPILLDQPRQPKKVVSGDKQPQLRYGPSFAQQYSEYYDSEEESDDDDYDESEILPAKVCGLVPRFFLKGSHCLLNHVPARSVRTRTPISPPSRVGTVSSSTSYWSKTEHEHSSFDTSGRKSIDGSLTMELHEEKNDLNMQNKQISSKLECTYPHKSIHPSDMPQYPKDTSSVDINSHEKGYKSFKDMLADKNTSEEVDNESFEFEKTLYVDSVHVQKESRPLPSDPDHNSARRRMLEDLSKESSLVKQSSVLNKGDQPQTVLQKFLDFNVLPSADVPIQNTEEREAPKASVSNQNSHQDGKLVTDKVATLSPKKQGPKVQNLQKTNEICPDFSIPPPLPKTPSDSWLWRTLPSICSKNSFSHPHFTTGLSPRHQTSKTQPSDDSKWENMVKTSKAQLQNLRYSAVNASESLAPIPEN